MGELFYLRVGLGDERVQGVLKECQILIGSQFELQGPRLLLVCMRLPIYLELHHDFLIEWTNFSGLRKFLLFFCLLLTELNVGGMVADPVRGVLDPAFKIGLLFHI